MPSNTPVDAELLAGMCVIVLSVGAAVTTAVRCCLARPHNRKKRLTICSTTPRYVLTSETTAFTACRYQLDAGVEYRVSAMCSVCNNKPTTTIFTDCGHSMACPSCAHEIWKADKRCPLCKCSISSVMHIVAHNVNTARVEELCSME